MKSALVASAYRSGQKLQFDREDLTIDYTRRRGVLMEGILAPEDAPGWVSNREDLWNALETKEKRCDARLARDFTLSLPHQFSHEQMHEAVTGFLQNEFVSRGLVCDFAIHAPTGDDKRNFHVHCLLTERPVTEHGFSPRKDRTLNEFGKIEEWRAAWETELNRIFERDQITDQRGELYWVDRRSYRERGIEKEAGIHLGPAASKLERAGIATEAGNVNREIAERNAERGRLQAELTRVDGQLRAEERQHAQREKRLAAERQAAAERAREQEAAAKKHARQEQRLVKAREAAALMRRQAEQREATERLQTAAARAAELQQLEARQQEKRQRAAPPIVEPAPAIPVRRLAEQPAVQARLNDDLDRATDAAHAEERRREKIRALLGDDADITLTDSQVMDKQRAKSIRDIYGEVGAEIEDAQPVLKPKPRDLGFGRELGR